MRAFAHRKRMPDSIGQRYERLVIIAEAPPYVQPSTGVRQRQWTCRCDCGTEKVVGQRAMRTGMVKSCGCLNEELKKQRITHGHARKGAHSGAYKAWRGIFQRCENPNTDQWANYGGRGITVCESWRDFANFLADMGERPRGKSIERLDVDGNYEPSNCVWATAIEQARNQRRTIWVHYRGKERCLKEACELSGVNYMTAIDRLQRGWPAERALSP